MRKYPDLYYIPEEELEGVLRAQLFRKRFGIIQLVVSFILFLSFACTNADVCMHPPYWTLIVGAIFALNGAIVLKKFSVINFKYDLKMW